jgi:basic amino acid/polyamine antiporter, APA family
VPDPSLHPARTLSLFSATNIVIGAIIGVGVFFGASTMAKLTQSGPLLLAAWGVGGLIALCGALVFAELGGRYQGNGAQYEVLRDSYGPLPAFLFVFCNATAIQGGAIGVIATVCAQNLFAAAGSPPPTGYLLLAISAGLIVVVMEANIAGVRWGSGIQNFTVVAKLAAIFVIIALAAASGGHTIGEPCPPLLEADGSIKPVPAPIAAVLAALIPAMFAYGGWQHSLWISGEIKNPRTNLPRAVIVGVFIVVVVYLAVNWAYLTLLGVGGVAKSDALAADAVSSVGRGGSFGKRAIAAAVAVSAFGVLNAQLLSGPRLVYGMARDGRFFGPFARLRNGTPVAAILMMSVVSMVLLLVSSVVREELDSGLDVIGMLGTGAVFIDAVFFILTGVAIFILRRRGKVEGAFRMPGYPIIPALFVIGETGALVGAYMNKETARVAWVGVAWILGAAALYLAYFRTKSQGTINPPLS